MAAEKEMHTFSIEAAIILVEVDGIQHV